MFMNFYTKYHSPSKHSADETVDQFKYDLEYFIYKIDVAYSNIL